jgi:predicted nucleotidyltransferase
MATLTIESPDTLVKPFHERRIAARLNVSPETLAAFCQRHHIRKLAMFGSVLRDDFRPESDVDVLVEFDPAYIPGYIRLAGMELELSRILGRKADLNTPKMLSRYFRDQVLAQAEVQYAQG